MRYLLLSIIIISLVGILMVPNAFAKEVIVNNERGTSTPGCEETNSCFDPNPVRININDKITWVNRDSAVAHTVTSGTPTTGPDGYFDSGLLMSGSYSKTFRSVGSYDYFCMIHPWMEGEVIVSGGTSSPSSTSKTPTKLTVHVNIPMGAALVKNYEPSTVKIEIGDTIKWTLFDKGDQSFDIRHTITSDLGLFDSGYMQRPPSPSSAPPPTFTHTFNEGGIYNYHCKIHSWMTGSVIVGGGTSSPSSTSKTSTNLILDPLPSTFKAKGSDSRADVTFSGKLETADSKFFVYSAPITLKFTGFTVDGKNHYEITTDDKGKFNEKFTLPVGVGYRIQAVFDGGESSTKEVFASSKSQTESFIVTSTSSQPSTSSVGGPTFLKLDPLSDTFQGRSVITFSGQLLTADRNSTITGAAIKLVFTPTIETWNTKSTRLTDDEGKFDVRIAIPPGQNYSIQAVYDGSSKFGSSKSQTEYFTVTSTSSPTFNNPTQSSGGFEYALITFILLGVGAGVAAVFINKSRKKKPKATPQRKTSGVKQPRKRRTTGSPVGVPSSVDGPSTYGYFECPNCHEPSAPQGKLGQNPDGSQFCSVCGWKS